MKLLFKYSCHVICLGDPFQLPPIDDKEDNHFEFEDVFEVDYDDNNNILYE